MIMELDHYSQDVECICHEIMDNENEPGCLYEAHREPLQRLVVRPHKPRAPLAD